MKPVDLAKDLVDIDAQIDDLEDMLGEAKAKRKQLVEHDLPTAMRNEQVSKFSADIGNRQFTLAIQHKVVGALSRAPDVDAALDYLVSKGFTGASRATVSVTVDDENRQQVIDKLADSGQIKIVRKINHNTLVAFARECIANGDGFDLDTVGLSTLVETTIKEN